MTERPDFRELVGNDLSPEERERLERVHNLLVEAGPPPELPPKLVQPDLDPREESVVRFMPLRRAGLMLGLVAAIALVAFVGGFVSGRAKAPASNDAWKPFTKDIIDSMPLPPKEGEKWADVMKRANIKVAE